MKKSRRLVTVLFMSTVLAVVLCGCSHLFWKPTTESVLTKVDEEFKDVDSIETSMEVKLDMMVSSGDFELPFTAEGVFESSHENTSNGYVTYVVTDMKMSMYGMTQDSKSESYIICEDDVAYNYYYDDTFEVWLKEETTANSKDLSDVKFIDLMDYLELSEDGVVDYDGNECYLLSGKMSASDLFVAGLLGSEEDGDIMELTGEFEDKFDVELYVNKDTFIPVSLILSIEDVSTEEDDVLSTISELIMTITVKSVNSGSNIHIPDEVKDAEEVFVEYGDDWEDSEEYNDYEEYNSEDQEGYYWEDSDEYDDLEDFEDYEEYDGHIQYEDDITNGLDSFTQD